MDDYRDGLRSGIDVERVAHRLAEAARAGQLVRAQCEEPSLVGRQQQFVGLRMQHIGGRIAFLVFELLVQRQVPLAPRTQPFCDRMMVTGSFSIIAFMLNSTAGAAFDA